MSRDLSFSRKVHAHDFFVIPGKNVPVGKRRMRPADAAPLAKLVLRWVQELCPADLVVAVRRELGDDQLAPLIEQKVAIAVLHEMDGAPAGRWNGRLVLPNA